MAQVLWYYRRDVEEIDAVVDEHGEDGLLVAWRDSVKPRTPLLNAGISRTYN